MESPDTIFRGGSDCRWHALFSSWLPTLVYCPGDLPVVNESFHPYSQCARKCARCPKVENSVASEPSKSTSQCIAVCTKRRSSEQRSQCAARSSRDLSAQPVHRTIPGRDFLKVASKMEALVGSQLKKVPRARGYGSRRTVFFGEASSKSRGRSDDSYTVRYSFRGRLHGISMISS